jgi:hypothetical protein
MVLQKFKAKVLFGGEGGKEGRGEFFHSSQRPKTFNTCI